MASWLRQIVASPRVRHPEANLDLCYVTDRIIATSGPSSTWPQQAYRNPLDALVKFLDSKHREEWAIWEFRAEGTGYPDSEVYNRIWHYPWPDHHPPPFHLVPNIMASMRNWLHANKDRVVVVHCKAGKGRSGTVSCSYLISEEGWNIEDAIKRFTEQRMRSGFGAGVSIPSQLRTLTYVDRWTQHGKIYVERQVEIMEVRVFGLRDGVKVAIEGFVDGGKVIKNFHTFEDKEIDVVRGKIPQGAGIVGLVSEVLGRSNSAKKKKGPQQPSSQTKPKPLSTDEVIDKHVDGSDGETKSATTSRNTSNAGDSQPTNSDEQDGSGCDVILRPSMRVILPTSDVNVDFERRNTTAYNLSMVTSVAHVWFNTFFEGHGPEQDGRADHSGVFSLDWDKLDGIKGSSRKGARAFDYFELHWKVYEQGTETVIHEPKVGEQVAQEQAADWRGNDLADEGYQKDLGLRTQSPTASEENDPSIDTQMKAQKTVNASEVHVPTSNVHDSVKTHVTTDASPDSANIRSPTVEVSQDTPASQNSNAAAVPSASSTTLNTQPANTVATHAVETNPGKPASTTAGAVTVPPITTVALSGAAPSRKRSVKEKIKDKVLGRSQPRTGDSKPSTTGVSSSTSSKPLDSSQTIKEESNNGRTYDVIAGSMVDTTSGQSPQISTADLPGGKPESEMKTAKEHTLGHLRKGK